MRQIERAVNMHQSAILFASQRTIETLFQIYKHRDKQGISMYSRIIHIPGVVGSLDKRISNWIVFW